MKHDTLNYRTAKPAPSSMSMAANIAMMAAGGIYVIASTCVGGPALFIYILDAEIHSSAVPIAIVLAILEAAAIATAIAYMWAAKLLLCHEVNGASVGQRIAAANILLTVVLCAGALVHESDAMDLVLLEGACTLLPHAIILWLCTRLLKQFRPWHLMLPEGV